MGNKENQILSPEKKSKNFLEVILWLKMRILKLIG